MANTWERLYLRQILAHTPARLQPDTLQEVRQGLHAVGGVCLQLRLLFFFYRKPGCQRSEYDICKEKSNIFLLLSLFFLMSF